MVLVLGLALPVAAPVLADNTGFKFPKNYATGITGNSPSNPAGAIVDDVVTGDIDSAKCAIFSQSGGSSELYYDFGFGIPSGATINGIEVVVSGYNDLHADVPLTFGIRLSGDTGGSWTGYKETSTLGVTDADYTLGGSADLWGKAWNDGNFSDGTFRLEVVASHSGKGDTVSLDSVSIKVYYHATVNAPTVTSINANQGTQGQTLQIIITGTNLTGATAVSFGAGITVNSFTINSAAQITANITIDPSAVAGARDISVTTPGGTATLTGGFTVNASAPTTTAVTPAGGNQGQCPMTVVITGANLTGATAVRFGAGITVSGFTVNSATQITATICLDANATPGAYNMSVTTPGGTATLTGGFIVVQQNQVIGTGAPTSHGGSFVSGTTSPAPPVSLPNIQIQSASLSTEAVTPSMPITVTVDIANKSVVNDNKEVTLYVNGQVETTQGVTVNRGGSSKLTFNISRSEPGDYSVYVDGVPAGSFRVELFSATDGILIFSVALIALAFVAGVVMLWRRQHQSR